MEYVKNLLRGMLLLSSMTVFANEQPMHVYMVGDSTMSIKEMKDYPETGWGMPFSTFFDGTIVVDNRAKNGRSTRTFISELRWQGVIEQLKINDIVIIQFGHNDQSKHKLDRYTPPDEFVTNLTQFINDVRERRGIPLLMTPITRRYFDEQGKIKDTHPIYADLVRRVAKETLVDFIDMERVTQEYFQSLEDAGSAMRFMHLAANVHPNYPNGVTDNTHLNELGAREVAQLVLAQLRVIDHPLVTHLRKPDPKHLNLSAPNGNR
ncbi:rhamnogalacturonan acetylesterase [Shewanella sp. A14]